VSALEATPARLRAAAALRRLTSEFLLRDATEDDLDDLVAVAGSLTAGLAAGPMRRRSFDEIVAEPDAPEIADGGAVEHFDQCFVTGPAHTAGLAATVRREADAVELRVRIPVLFEGMPGHAHGGIVAAVFDDLIGMVMGRLHRVPAPTVQVDVSFRRPVPLDAEVVFRAELSGSDGRKRTVQAAARVGDTLHATATGLLVVLNADQLAAGLR
jgi:acyl-coenzyme A thioesterase PaaI-like protein